MLFLVGLVSLLAQVVLLRELNVAFYGIELAYLVALAAWLAATAAGASLVPRRRSGAPRGTSWLIGAAALAVPLDVAFIRRSRLLLGGVPGAYLPIERQLLVLLVAVIPIAFLSGLAFRRAARAHTDAGGRLAGAYALESAGAAVAGLASMLAFKAGAQTFPLAVATTVGALGWVAAAARGSRAWRATTGLLTACVSIVVLSPAAALDRGMTRWTHPSLVATRDTPYARVSISRNASQVSVFENDVLAYDSETADNEPLPHLAALQCLAPARILLLGGSVELLDRELARHRPATLDHVEIDAATVTAARRALWTNEKGDVAKNGPDPSPASREPEHSRGAMLRIDDPRAFLLRTATTYDLILIALPEPVSGQTNRFYTTEFFQACARRLASSGVLGLRLQVPENYLAPAALLRAASVLQALRAVFPFVDVLPASPTVAVASRAPLPDAAVVMDRLRARRLDTRLVTPSYVNYLYTNDRRHELRTALASARVPVNRDAQPISYLYAAVGWLSKFMPSLLGANAVALVDTGGRAAWRWGALACVAVLFLMSRWRPAARRAALALAAGAAGMSLETVVLLDYQAKSGALFEDLGVLVMAFMAGSALGAWSVGVLAGDAARTPAPPSRRRSAAIVAAFLLAGLSGCSLLCGWLAASGTLLGLMPGTLLLAAIGAGVGGVFACASLAVSPDDEGGMGRLYGADLLGGCLGSLAASAALVPLAGLDVTSYAVAVFTALALLAV